MSRNTVKIMIIRKMDVSSQTFQDDTHANTDTDTHTLSLFLKIVSVAL